MERRKFIVTTAVLTAFGQRLQVFHQYDPDRFLRTRYQSPRKDFWGS